MALALQCRLSLSLQVGICRRAAVDDGLVREEGNGFGSRDHNMREYVKTINVANTLLRPKIRVNAGTGAFSQLSISVVPIRVN
jgi:hypothetical protein